MNDFSVHRIIGRGGFGEVYGCRKADTGKMYAMKCLDKKRIKMKQGETLALNERTMLSLVSTGVSQFSNFLFIFIFFFYISAISSKNTKLKRFMSYHIVYICHFILLLHGCYIFTIIVVIVCIKLVIIMI